MRFALQNSYYVCCWEKSGSTAASLRRDTTCPSGGRVSGLLPTQALDGLYGAAGTMPAEEFEFLVLECVCGPEELFQLLPCPGRKVADVLQIGLERGAVGHREHTVVPFLLVLGLLLDLEDPDGFASKHHAGIGLRVDRKSTRLNSSHGYISY